MAQLLPYQPSLASATQTRVDSACKHIHQCRVSTDDLLALTTVKNDQDQLQREKYRFCVHKDECVLGIARPWAPDLCRKKGNNAYPRVTSTLGAVDMTTKDLEAPWKMIRYMYHYARSVRERDAIVRFFKEGNYHDPKTSDVDFNLVTLHNDSVAFEKEATTNRLKLNFKPWLNMMADFTPVGYANTLGWAHPNSGDTMTSVMVGGLRTVMNGDFEIFTGDLIQWYWPFELDCFTASGKRKEYVQGWELNTSGTTPVLLPPNVNPSYDPATAGGVTLSRDAEDRERYHKRQFGQPADRLKMVARIKPYMRDDENPRLYDGYRVFAVALSCGRPHEMVDIKIARQSL